MRDFPPINGGVGLLTAELLGMEFTASSIMHQKQRVVGELRGQSSEADAGSQAVLHAVGNKAEMMVSLGWVSGDLKESSTEQQVEVRQSQQQAKRQVETVSASGYMPPDRDGRRSQGFFQWVISL